MGGPGLAHVDVFFEGGQLSDVRVEREYHREGLFQLPLFGWVSVLVKEGEGESRGDWDEIGGAEVFLDVGEEGRSGEVPCRRRGQEKERSLNARGGRVEVGDERLLRDERTEAIGDFLLEGRERVTGGGNSPSYSFDEVSEGGR